MEVKLTPWFKTALVFGAGCLATYLVVDCRLKASCKADQEQQQKAPAVAEQKRQALWRFNVESTLYFGALDEAFALACNGEARPQAQQAQWRRERRAQFEWALTELGARFQSSGDVKGAAVKMQDRVVELGAVLEAPARKPPKDTKATCAEWLEEQYGESRKNLVQLRLELMNGAAKEAFGP